MLMIAPQGVRKWRKATVKKRRNTAPGFKALDPKILPWKALKVMGEKRFVNYLNYL